MDPGRRSRVVNRIADAWASLVEAMNKDGVVDANQLETMRFVFVAGAVTFRRLQLDTVANSIDPDDVTDVADMEDLHYELDAMAEDIRQVQARDESREP